MANAPTVSCDIARRLDAVTAAIAGAAAVAGRRPEDVRLIAVSKTRGPEEIAAALAAGQRDFGESTVQEAVDKIARFAGEPIAWHFIGHLQTNKAKWIPGGFAWLHSLDSLELAQRLSRQAAARPAHLNALIQVNVARDPSKHGLLPQALYPFLEALANAALPGLAWRGLMTIAPQGADRRRIRACFAELRALREGCVARFGWRDFTELSMGMSEDYVEAIAEGATQVRIGSAIFGKRAYPPRR